MKASDYQITQPIQLKDRETHQDFGKKKELEKELNSVSKKNADIQNAMYAQGKYAALICIQGMDTAGKDSLIREVFKNFRLIILGGSEVSEEDVKLFASK